MTDAVQRPLGSLEQAVMDVLWNRPSATVHDVMEALPDHSLAYTTVMTTLDRLHKKGLLTRTKRSHAYCYEPAFSREEFARRLLTTMLGGFPASSRHALIAGFLDFADDDADTLSELERLIAERKRQVE